MRFLEFAPDYVSNEAGALMTILQHLTARNPKGVKVPVNNVLKLMQNTGYNLNYYSLDSLIKNNPNLKDMVTDYDAQTMTIGKEAPEPEQSGAEPGQEPRQITQPETDEKTLKTVDSMAKSALK